MRANWWKRSDSGVILCVKAVPRSKKNAIEPPRDGRLIIRVTAPPVDAKANKAIITILSKTLKVPKSKIKIISGEKSRDKTIEIEDADVNAVERLGE